MYFVPVILSTQSFMQILTKLRMKLIIHEDFTVDKFLQENPQVIGKFLEVHKTYTGNDDQNIYRKIKIIIFLASILYKL